MAYDKKLEIFADTVEKEAEQQIKRICKHPAFKYKKIRIMPDTHAGAGCVIGFTATYDRNMLIPNLIGVDIGCGVLTCNLTDFLSLDETALEGLDNVIRNHIPSGFDVRSDNSKDLYSGFSEKIRQVCELIGDMEHFDYHCKSIGTLGGGNHFIEVAKSDDDFYNRNGYRNVYLTIHTGSRNFGHKIATHFQNLAIQKCPDKALPNDLKYLTGKDADDYMFCMQTAQAFAANNRRAIMWEILDRFDYSEEEDGELDYFDTVHNYTDGRVIRKGAVDATYGKSLIIPLNMRDGSFICRGLGNHHWNNSAPHGAGRMMSRTKAKNEISMDTYQEQMKGIFTTSVCKATLDEAPDAYKDFKEIEKWINSTAKIEERILPVYNFKAH